MQHTDITEASSLLMGEETPAGQTPSGKQTAPEQPKGQTDEQLSIVESLSDGDSTQALEKTKNHKRLALGMLRTILIAGLTFVSVVGICAFAGLVSPIITLILSIVAASLALLVSAISTYKAYKADKPQSAELMLAQHRNPANFSRVNKAILVASTLVYSLLLGWGASISLPILLPLGAFPPLAIFGIITAVACIPVGIVIYDIIFGYKQQQARDAEAIGQQEYYRSGSTESRRKASAQLLLQTPDQTLQDGKQENLDSKFTSHSHGKRTKKKKVAFNMQYSTQQREDFKNATSFNKSGESLLLQSSDLNQLYQESDLPSITEVQESMYEKSHRSASWGYPNPKPTTENRNCSQDVVASREGVSQPKNESSDHESEKHRNASHVRSVQSQKQQDDQSHSV